ncbi:uncharacterized transmembrane protein DDB_G0289901-like [Diaphorina citri]|uniref:Uncharacterized transmembrane protein DDB_G0289901-like n=1 Tax=Diaphorina citri TaxID=121845 RepID=A0A1S3D2W2_DIACI|nr:uncharacterized transmembrane protein DDB_G0289901-like [Diaphorina citri]
MTYTDYVENEDLMNSMTFLNSRTLSTICEHQQKFLVIPKKQEVMKKALERELNIIYLGLTGSSSQANAASGAQRYTNGFEGAASQANAVAGAGSYQQGVTGVASRVDAAASAQSYGGLTGSASQANVAAGAQSYGNGFEGAASQANAVAGAGSYQQEVTGVASKVNAAASAQSYGGLTGSASQANAEVKVFDTFEQARECSSEKQFNMNQTV